MELSQTGELFIETSPVASSAAGAIMLNSLNIAAGIVIATLGMVDTMLYSLYRGYGGNEALGVEGTEQWDLRVQFDDMILNASAVKHQMEQVIGGIEWAEPTVLDGAILSSYPESHVEIQCSFGIFTSSDQQAHQFIWGAPGSELSNEGIVISVVVAQELNVGIGDNISIKNPKITEVTSLDPFRAKFDLVWESVRVTGLVDEMTGHIAYGTIDYMKQRTKMADWMDPSNIMYVKLIRGEGERDLEEVRSDIYNNVAKVRSVDTIPEIMGDFLGLMEIMFLIVYIIVIFGAILGAAMIFNTVLVNLIERGREIATLRTVGTSRTWIIWGVTLENLGSGLIGVIPGLILGIFLILLMFSIMELDFIRFAIQITPNTFLLTGVTILLTVFLSEIIPLRRIIRENLAEATKERIQ